MPESQKQNNQFLVSQKSVEGFVSASTQQAMQIKRRVGQKLRSVAIARKLSDKLRAFDKKMVEKHGRTYKTMRNIAIATGLYVTALNFGVAGLTALCAYKIAKHAKPFLKDVEKKRQEGKVTGVIDYLGKNKTGSLDSLSSVAFTATSAASTLCGVELPVDFGQVKAIGKNVKSVSSSVSDAVQGKTSWKETGEVLVSASLAVVASAGGVNSVVAKGDKKGNKQESVSEKENSSSEAQKNSRQAMMNEMLSGNGRR